MAYPIRLTLGHVLRHAPASSAAGFDAACIDIAQDLLLRQLADQGLLDMVAFKGGTALRKLYAGASGRFSTDLDFVVSNLTESITDVQGLLVESVHDAVIGPFRYRIVERRGRSHITYETDFGRTTGRLTSKIDIGPPPWLAPAHRSWVPLPTHDRYGGPLPRLPTVALEENVAEKIARLNRRTLARDAFDLVWVATHPAIALDQQLTRRLAVLKCWVDLHGLSTTMQVWNPIADARPFDPDRWLRARPRSEFDDEQIGLLTTPAPDLDDLGRDLGRTYGWLADLDAQEAVIARGSGGDRATVLRLLAELDGGRMAGACW